jgi:hypothetical protein
MNDLDREYPQGNPRARNCRWCHTPRIDEGTHLRCDKCDGPPQR